jgi:hypothetical protein
MSDPELSLLNVYEVETDGSTHHIVCFLDAVLAGARGIDSRAVVGEFTPQPDGRFDPETFELNPEFIEVFTQYMNEESAQTEQVVQEASANPSAWLYVIDPRSPNAPAADPPPSDVLGCFAVDDHGQVVPNSFQYNSEHVLFDPAQGVSGILADRRFYDWLHPIRNPARE